MRSKPAIPAGFSLRLKWSLNSFGYRCESQLHMPQTLHTFCSDGTRALPLDLRPVLVALDNCALSMMLNERERQACPRAMQLRKYLRGKAPGTLILQTGPAILEGALRHTDVSLKGLLSKKTELVSDLLGRRCTEETLIQFAEGVAMALTEQMLLLLLLDKAHSIFHSYHKRGPDENWRASNRIKEFLSWASTPEGLSLGAQTTAALPIYCALGFNVEARAEFGISAKRSGTKLLNGAWDLLHVHQGTTAQPAAYFKVAPWGLKPVSLFATSDQGLARVFSFFKHNEKGAVAFKPIGLPANRMLINEIDSRLRYDWPRLPNPDAYARHLHAIAEQSWWYTAGGGAEEVQAMRTRCYEIADLLRNRFHFSMAQTWLGR